jgi:hypothetical protein
MGHIPFLPESGDARSPCPATDRCNATLLSFAKDERNVSMPELGLLGIAKHSFQLIDIKFGDAGRIPPS